MAVMPSQAAGTRRMFLLQRAKQSMTPFGQEIRGRGQTPGVSVPGTFGYPTGKLADQIADRARQIWEEEGRPDGRAEEHWLRAEAEIAQGAS